MIRERQTYIDVLRMTCMICVISFPIFVVIKYFPFEYQQIG